MKIPPIATVVLLTLTMASCSKATHQDSDPGPLPLVTFRESFLATDSRVDAGSAGNATAPRLAIAGSRVYAVWADGRSGNSDVYLSYSTDRGQTWLTTDLRVDQDPGTGVQDSPGIAVSGTTVHVVWRDGRSGNFDIYYRKSTDGGASWAGNEKRVDAGPGATASGPPVIAASGAAVYVGYSDSRDGDSDLWFVRSSDSGASWSATDQRIDQDAGTGTQDQLAIAATASEVYFAWRDNRGGIFSDIYSRAATALGAEFIGNEKRVDTDPANTVARHPSIAVAGTNVHVAWVDERGGDADIRYNFSSNRAQAWLSSDSRVDQAPVAVGSDSPSISASGSNVFVAWRDERNGNGDVFFRASISSGESWLSDDRRIDSDAGTAEVAAPSACSDGVNVAVGWSDSRSGNADIRLNRSVQ